MATKAAITHAKHSARTDTGLSQRPKKKPMMPSKKQPETFLSIMDNQRTSDLKSDPKAHPCKLFSRTKKEKGEDGAECVVPLRLRSTQSTSTASEGSAASLHEPQTQANKRLGRKNHLQTVLHASLQPNKRQVGTLEQRHCPGNVVDIRDQVYASPTFNDAPAPSALPVPAFLPPQRRAPSRITVPREPDPDRVRAEIQRGLQAMLKLGV